MVLPSGSSPRKADSVEPTVLIVEDDAMVRDWIQRSLEGSEFRVVGVAHTIGDVPDLVERRRPSLLLLDYRLPDGIGTELLRDLRQSGVAIPAILMTANEQAGFNEAARDAGAQGTALKSGRVEELLEVLHAVARGDSAFDPRHPQRHPGRAALSPREREVLQLVASGSTNKEIAATLSIGGETVKTMLARVFAKLGVRRRAEAVAEAHHRGLI
jgi:DNA-binding NarL/FixJ family response regulator